MKKIAEAVLLLWALVCVTTLSAQKVTWSSDVEHIEGDVYRITITADIPRGWHMYDMGPYETGGPNATQITFTPDDGVELVGEVVQVDTPVRKYDEFMKMEIGYFEKRAQFRQDVKFTAEAAEVLVSMEWMICNDTSCMPPDDDGLTVLLLSDDAAAITTSASVATPSPGEAETATLSAIEEGSAGSLWRMIVEAVLWGFAALLTPCVFPMIPMTVSYFLKSSGNAALARFRALKYGLFIVLLYTIPISVIILLTRIIGGDSVTANIFNWLATHWLPNLIFFIVFMLFAASFFGAFEIVMPGKLVNDTDTKSSRKGLGGIFFMAFTLVLVSFSCTGPIVGTVLIKSISGEFWSPIVTMLAFSIAFALPFTLFALFPSWLGRLPKSGGWLNSVKVVIGFIELALGLKFLSVADQTYHWGILDREIYLALWIVVFTLMGFYLLGKLKFKHDSDVKYISVGRLALAIATFSFVVYMLPGMWGAPLKGLSGYLPPLHTQDFVLGASMAPAVPTSSATSNDSASAKYADNLSLPYGLDGFFDLAQAEAYAITVDKPLFIDFTGHGCVNCREMEARVWSDERVLDMLRNEYVVVALYCDDRMNVAESDWVVTENGKVLKTLGKINSHIALTEYGVNAQPYYVLQGRGGQVLVPPRGYNLDIDAFVEFLKSGVETYKADKQ